MDPYNAHQWQRLMLDAGANVDAVGAPQRQAFMRHTGLDFPIRRVAAKVSTAGGTTCIVGEASARMPLTSPDSFAEVTFKALSTASSMILGLPTMNTLDWTVCTQTCTLDIGDGRILPILMRNGHLFLYWRAAAHAEDSARGQHIGLHEVNAALEARPSDPTLTTALTAD